MKNYILITFLFLIISSCNVSKNNSTSIDFNLSVKNEKAIKFYKSAKLKIQRGDFVGAKSDFESALRIEPGFIMACLQINENDIFKKNQYTKRARDNYSTATDTERLFIDLSKATSRSERISILTKISEINLNNAEIFYLLGNEYGNYGPGLDSKNRDISYKKALEIDPNHWPTKRKIFGIKYGGFGDPGSAKTVDDFFIYPDSVSILESDIEKMFNLDTLNAFVFRKFGDIYRYSNDLDQSKEYYLKGVNLCDKTNNSFKPELLHTLGNASFLLGNLEDAFNFFQLAIDSEFDPYLKMKQMHRMSMVAFRARNHKKAIEVLDDIESSFKILNLSRIEQIAEMITINNYKSFYYADLGMKKKSYEAFKLFQEYGAQIYNEIPDFDISFINSRNNTIGIPSGLNDRFGRILPNNLEYDMIWLKILNGDINEAKNLIENSKLNQNQKNYFNILIEYKLGNHKKVVELGNKVFSQNSLGNNYIRFHYAKSLLELGNSELAKPIFERCADARAFGWTTGFFNIQSKEILKSL